MRGEASPPISWNNNDMTRLFYVFPSMDFGGLVIEHFFLYGKKAAEKLVSSLVSSLDPTYRKQRNKSLVTVEGFLGSAVSAMTGLSTRIELS